MSLASRPLRDDAVAVCRQILGEDCVMRDPLGGATSHFELVPKNGICVVVMMRTSVSGTVYYSAEGQQVHNQDFSELQQLPYVFAQIYTSLLGRHMSAAF